MQPGDGHYVQLCLDGHPEAFRHLVERYQAPLVAYLAGRLGTRAGAEEAAQETFVRSYRRLNGLRKPDSFFSWLLGIATRVAKEEQRRKARRLEAAEELRRQRRARAPEPDFGLERAIGELSEPYRQVILLRFYGGLSCAQTAEQLGIPLGTVTKRLSRAYRMLREKLSSSHEHTEERR
ncbi:MAG: RNA polymerase sigma factor [Candidatus Brocadiaceae bacterium]|jgi:RNA polymerase sigma-70 factor (ECF subfamily)